MRRCQVCGSSILTRRVGAVTCSPRCRKALSRRTLPVEMTSRRAWVRAVGKRPITVAGRAASSTDAGTWSSFAEVRASSAGDGFGVMLGGGLGCYDLDHVSLEQAREFAATIPEPIVFAERSMSGEGVHIFVLAEESPGTKRGNVERYTRQRFIRVTGDRISL